jgi:predicted dehydrogenase
MYVRALENDHRTRIALIADPDPEAVATSGATCPAVTPDELIRDPGVDCVCVLTPHSVHAEQVEAALGAGKHVIVEKPLALDIEQAETLLRTARAARRHLIVRHYLRYAPFTTWISRALARGALGPILTVSMEYATNQMADLNRPGGWRGTWRGAGGGALMDLGVHGLDVLREVFGLQAVESCMCVTAGDARQDGADDAAAVLARLPSGGIAYLVVTCVDTSTAAPRWRWQAIGERARVEVAGDWSTASLSLTRPLPRPTTGFSRANRHWTDWWERANRASVRAAAQQIAEAAPNTASAERGVDTLRLVLSAYSAAGLSGSI